MHQKDSLFNSSNRILQVHRVDQTLLPAQVDSFVGCSLHCALHPPANVRRLEQKKFYICSDVTHTQAPLRPREPHASVPNRWNQGCPTRSVFPFLSCHLRCGLSSDFLSCWLITPFLAPRSWTVEEQVFLFWTEIRTGAFFHWTS